MNIIYFFLKIKEGYLEKFHKENEFKKRYFVLKEGYLYRYNTEVFFKKK